MASQLEGNLSENGQNQETCIGAFARKFEKYQLTSNSQTSLPLIGQTGTQLQAYSETLDLLKGLQKPLAVLSACGPYRSGKSYLLSKIISPDKEQEVFKVGHTSNACTHGIWMSTTALECKDFILLVLDTEGTGAVGEKEAEVSKLITLTVLISSLLIYNMQGVPQQSHFQNMSFFANMSSNIIFQDESSDCTTDIDFKQLFPDFLWLMRDVCTKIVDKDEKSTTPTEYIRNQVLAPNEKSESDGALAMGDIFPTIEGEAIPHPNGNPAEVGKAISPQFKEGISRIVQQLLGKVRPKSGLYAETSMTGPVLVNFIEKCVSVINKCEIPVVFNCWYSSIYHYLLDESKKLLIEYEEEMKVHLQGKLPIEDGLPWSEQLIDEGHKTCEGFPETLMGIHLQIMQSKCKSLETKLRSQIPLLSPQQTTDDVHASVSKRRSDHEEYLEAFKKQLLEYKTDDDGRVSEITGGCLLKFAQENFVKSQTLCEEALKRIYQQLCSQSQAKQYTVQQFNGDRKDAEDQYNKKAIGPAKSQVFKTLSSLIQEKEGAVRLAESMENKEVEIKRMEETIKDQQRQLSELQSQQVENEGKLDELYEILNSKDEEIKQLKSTIQSLQTKLEKEENNRKKVREKLEEMKQNQESSAKQIQEFQKKFQLSDETCNTLQSKINELSRELESKESEKQKAQLKQEQIKAQLDNLQRLSEDSARQVAQQISDLQQKNVQLENSFKEQTKEMLVVQKRVNELTPPKVPTNLEAYIPTTGTMVPNKVVVTWTMPERDATDNQPAILCYEVELKEYGTNKRWERAIVNEAAINLTTTTVESLKYNTRYTFRVCSINMKGARSQWVTVNIKTGDKIPGIPQKFRSIARAKDKIKLAWSEPVENADAVVQYIVEYRQRYKDDFQEVETIPKFDTHTTYLVKGLNGWTRYQFRVAAINSSGDISPYSDVLKADTTYGTKRRVVYTVGAGLFGGVPAYFAWKHTAAKGDFTED